MKKLVVALALAACVGLSSAAVPENFKRENLVAWCIVPFDAAKRGPAERAQMLVDLGLRRCAYDWRPEHVESFEEEIIQYRKHDIEFFAFWDTHERAIELFEQYDLSPQLWRPAWPEDYSGLTQQEKVERAAAQLLPIAKQAKAIGGKFGIYNHGHWSGQPDNMIAVAQALRDKLGSDHVGIVYNLHHGHEHIDDFPAALERMKPYLLCINLDGMSELDQGGKILPIGAGKYEKQMIRAIIESGYDGAIGILDHIETQDAKVSLQNNLRGLERILSEICE